MVYLSVLGRQPEISLAELDALFLNVKQISPDLATFELPTNSQSSSNILSSANNPTLTSSQSSNNTLTSSNNPTLTNSSPNTPPQFPATPSSVTTSHVTSSSHVTSLILRLGGSIKLAVKLEKDPLSYLKALSPGKITLGISDYSKNASAKTAKTEALKLKKILVRHARSVRVIESKTAIVSTATSLHNGLSGKNPHKIEFIKHNNGWYRVIGVQDIDSYTRRDQARPARDAKVGMLPPKLAQILINLCGPLPPNSTILDPFCGTGVVLQEALLMGYRAYGTDLSERMVDYSAKNLRWLLQETEKDSFSVSCGDATTFKWVQPIDAIACEGYLGKPFARIPTEIELKAQKQECESIVLGFLKNLARQIKSGTPVVIAVPAWLRPDDRYERLDILKPLNNSLGAEPYLPTETPQGAKTFSLKKVDELSDMGYNVNNKAREGLLYHRDNQVVARDILILRKK